MIKALKKVNEERNKKRKGINKINIFRNFIPVITQKYIIIIKTNKRVNIKKKK